MKWTPTKTPEDSEASSQPDIPIPDSVVQSTSNPDIPGDDLHMPRTDKGKGREEVPPPVMTPQQQKHVGRILTFLARNPSEHDIVIEFSSGNTPAEMDVPSEPDVPLVPYDDSMPAPTPESPPGESLR